MNGGEVRPASEAMFNTWPDPRASMLGTSAFSSAGMQSKRMLVRDSQISTPTIVFWRLWMATPVMVCAAYFTGGRVSLPLLKIVFVPGMLFGVSMIVGFTSYQQTSIANATLIGALQPVLMLFIGPMLFGDRRGVRQVLLAVIALAGISTVVLGAKQSSGASLHGDVLAGNLPMLALLQRGGFCCTPDPADERLVRAEKRLHAARSPAPDERRLAWLPRWLAGGLAAAPAPRLQ